MGYKSNWPDWLKKKVEDQNAEGEVHVPAVGLPEGVEWSPLGTKVYSDTGSPATDIIGNTIPNKAGSSSTSSLGGGYGKKRIGEHSRKQMNLTSGRTSSILTS